MRLVELIHCVGKSGNYEVARKVPAIYLKMALGQQSEALKWLIRDVRYDPSIVWQRRWVDLATARWQRSR